MFKRDQLTLIAMMNNKNPHFLDDVFLLYSSSLSITFLTPYIEKKGLLGK
jgi:hypothetical protein